MFRMDVNRILAGIDEGLEGTSPELLSDQRRAIEDEVWADLSTWYEPEEAAGRFVAWRERFVGGTALRGTTGS